jgi:uncharacterized membrane protein YdjX (TVP38/TMEM64 family)
MKTDARSPFPRLNENQQRTLINILLIIITIGLFTVVTLEYTAHYDAVTENNLHQFIRSYGPWAPVMYAVVYLASAPLPFFAAIISAVGGLLFGTIRGAIFTIIISTFAALIPFVLARRLGAQWVAEKVEGKRLGMLYKQSSGKSGFIFVMILRLIPIVPWEVQSYVSGLTQVSLPSFFLATLLGGIPSSFAFSFLGNSMHKAGSWQFNVAVILVILLSFVIPAIVTQLRMRKQKLSD